MQAANQAALRMANDTYRQTIHKAAMFAANGVTTEKKAVDMAVHDFAKRGLNCIKYSNGARHNIKEYAEMAVRTAETRAMLMGEGKARQELGETLVQITKHGTACPLCVPFEGKVLIDDVYSGGTWENSKEAYEKVPQAKRAGVRYMSEAMKQGLYHPRCRHGLGTFYIELLEDEGKRETIEKIRVKKIWEGLPNEKRDIIVDAIRGGDIDFIQMAEKHMDNCHVTWDIDTDGGTRYINRSGHIVMTKPKDDTDLVFSFWHEYGHFLDDAEISGTGIQYVEHIKDRNGSFVQDFIFPGTSSVVENTDYKLSVIKDISKILDDCGLSNEYYVRLPRSEYDECCICRMVDDKIIDANSDYEDTKKLRKALSKKYEDLAGVTAANDYLYNMGYPRTPEYTDYFEYYRTPKRQILKTRPKYKGAQDDWNNAILKVIEEREAFEQTHDISAILAEQSRLQEKAQNRLWKMGWSADIVDGSVYGVFQSVVSLGGHTPDYYATHRGGIVEGVATIFMANITGDKDLLFALKKNCPELYKVITGVWKYGK